MTKRFGDFNNGQNKKPKIDNIDDLWGDDFDAKDIDDCLMMATQIYNQEKKPDHFSSQNNVSFLPSYNNFQNCTQKLFTSTQSKTQFKTNLSLPSTSKTFNFNECKSQVNLHNGINKCNKFENTTISLNNNETENVDLKIKQLQEVCETKEGEISILRSQLRSITENTKQEQFKKEKEWLDKLTTSKKEITTIRSELEFKNIEILNLKQTVTETLKLTNGENNLDPSQSPYFKSKTSEGTEITLNGPNIESLNSNEIDIAKDFKINVNVTSEYPLLNKIDSELFQCTYEERFNVDILNKGIRRNTVPFLQNRISQDLTDTVIKLHAKLNPIVNNETLKFSKVYADLIKLTKSNSYTENLKHINNVLCVSEQLLYNLLQFLQELELNSEVKILGKVDTVYIENHDKFMRATKQSLFKPGQWCKEEVGVNARHSIACLSAVIPHCLYSSEYLHCLTHMDLNVSDYHNLSILKQKENDEDKISTNLYLIKSIVIIIKKLKKSNIFSGVLSAICNMISNLSAFLHYPMYDVLCEIIREILFTFPNSEVLFHLSEVLANISIDLQFQKMLCKMPSEPQTKVELNMENRTITFNEDVCVLQILCALIEFLPVVEPFFDTHLNIFKFVFNSIKSNAAWLLYREERHCDCLDKFVKMFLEIMFQTFKLFRKKYNATNAYHYEKEVKLLHSGIEILHILNFNISDVIIKFIGTHAQYKDLIISLLNYRDILKLSDEKVKLLENLNVYEDIPIMEKNAFHNLGALWNDNFFIN